MDPEQRLLEVHKDLAVELFVFFLRTVVRMLHPQRMGIADGYRTSVDLDAVPGRRNLDGLLLSLIVFTLFGLSVFVNALHDHIVVAKLRFVDGVVLLGRVLGGEEDLDRHEGTVLVQNLTHTILVCELNAFVIQKQRDLGSWFGFASLLHIVLGTAVACPVYGHGAFFIGKGIDMNLIRHHERRIEAQAKMTDHLIVGRLVLILFKEFRRTRKCDLGNVFLDFVRRHSDTVIDEFKGFGFRIDQHADLRLIVLREGVFSHYLELFQLCNGVTAV